MKEHIASWSRQAETAVIFLSLAKLEIVRVADDHESRGDLVGRHRGVQEFPRGGSMPYQWERGMI